MLTTYTIEGFENIQYQGFQALSQIEHNLTNLYTGYGYHQVAIPTFETYDSFIGNDAISANELFKFISRKGRVLALKPDATLSVARMAAINHHDPNEIIKLFYQTNIYRHFSSPGDVRKEITQMGVEFFGDNSPECDGEVISLAIQSLKANGVDDVQIDLGHVGFINCLLDELTISKTDRAELFELIENKNIGDIQEFLSSRHYDPKISDIILELPMLYGDPTDVFARMTKLCINQKMQDVVKNLSALFEHLRSVGLDQYVTFDLGFTSSMNYYTDLIFKVYAGNWGAPIIDGGRYNKLSQQFGIDRPACGFAVNLLSLMDYLEEHDLIHVESPKHIVLLYRESEKKGVFDIASRLRAQGCMTEVFVINSLPTAMIERLQVQRLYQDADFYVFERDGVFKWEASSLNPVTAIESVAVASESE
ncbi:MAG: ATP phosphoribosyltransferase regulatory subunit [Eubacteriaceae bacterium]|jgi:ATP phosphoribosyltransferase regulatory subunit|uniref:ATP phosphoribosyltransferase regulatory subunit n=1 Tax=Candidatus Pseudoramibacter fermentans TaxID=2594427 RepID=A0A6L5GQI7_9FIRM|nr:ATP phosphoribosyltransferase regulatory subunit [Candidatus Pseudoramibacter fermentans]RRF92881.1 MAG: ATP phosphoribosyltransferase regulatory subunit [Eubacteriaceae bacterium]